ncbi:MAG: ABC transporter ATP-binding protein [Candidatus Eremiobacteraeota bacterium]|nr:ABC transporter ATP-binding protein [Candidatus Eremiobacteraeota bacterium]
MSVRYPQSDRDAVGNVTLDIAAGALIVLLGPSGCGKSTLLRTVNRMIEPRAGEIFVAGQEVHRTPITELRRRSGEGVGGVGLCWDMTVAQNISVVPNLLHWSKDRIAARVDELLALVQLEPQRYRGRYPRELSGGEQQRVGVARALAAQPEVLLMDEPFGAVDAIVRNSLQEETLRIHKALRTTILFVTHDVEEALLLADRIVVMSEGRILQYDTPLKVLSRPATPFVAQLLNSQDVVRRLGLLKVRDAMVPHAANSENAIDGASTLRAALNVFLNGTATLDVLENGERVGSISLMQLQRALRPT